MKIEYRCEFYYKGSSKHQKIVEESDMPRKALCKCGQLMHIKILERYCPSCGQEILYFGDSQFGEASPRVLCGLCFDSYFLKDTLIAKPTNSDLLLMKARKKKNLENERDELEEEIEDLNNKIEQCKKM
jgi:hypothetical protein